MRWTMLAVLAMVGCATLDEMRKPEFVKAQERQTAENAAAAERETTEAKIAGDIPLTIVNRTSMPVGYLSFERKEDAGKPGFLINDGKTPGRYGKARGSAIAPGASSTVKLRAGVYMVSAGQVTTSMENEHLFGHTLDLKRPTELVVYEKDKPAESATAGVERQVVLYTKGRREEDERKRADLISRPEQPDFRLGPDGPFTVGEPVVALWNAQPPQWYEGHVTSVGKGAVAVSFDLDGREKTVRANAQEVRHRIGGRGPYQPPAVQPAAAAAPGGSPSPATPSQGKGQAAPACKSAGSQVRNYAECCSRMTRMSKQGDTVCCTEHGRDGCG